MHALVLGGCGFLGSHLVERLLAEGWRVRCLSRRPPGVLPPVLLGHPRLELLAADLADRQALAEVLQGMDVAFHLASSSLPQSSNADPLGDAQQQLLGSLQLLEQARLSGLARLVVVSSGGTVYGSPQTVPIPETHPTEPSCIYGIHKLAIEKYCGLYRQLHGLNTCVLRVANPYGERQRLDAGQGVVAVFLAKALRGEPIAIWGDGTVVRDFLHVQDVVHALLAAANYTGPEWLFNIGSGEGTSLNRLLELLEAQLGHPLQRIYSPGRGCDVPTNVLAIDRARALLGWQPRVAMAEGLARFHASLVSPG
jgi:UDP-glucose 4-epimerase